MTARCTLAAPARHEVIVKHSRFLAHACAIDDPAHATVFLDSVRQADASHHCWAWRIGTSYRTFDDGEPGGTAGRPILAAIDGQRCDRVMVVVLRWFGGIKLGAGGLVRAYGGAAAQCLRGASHRELVEYVRAVLSCDFAHTGSVHLLLARFAAEKLDEAFDGHGVRMSIALPEEHLARLQAALADVTRGQGRVVKQ